MHDSLLFIDTPIGRVDPDNRQNFVNTLCEIAKEKPVILTFTPAEYDDKVAAAMLGQYASFNKQHNIGNINYHQATTCKPQNLINVINLTYNK